MTTLICPTCNGTGHIHDLLSEWEKWHQRRLGLRIKLVNTATEMGYSRTYLSMLEHGHRRWNKGLVDRYKRAIQRLGG